MRKQENIREDENSPTLRSYLNEISNQTISQARKEIKLQDWRKTLISCFVLIRDSSSKTGGAELDKILELFEDVSDGTEYIRKEGVINRLYVFLGREYFPQGKASGLQRELVKIKTKYFPDSAHKDVGYFREGLRNSPGSI
ncbi:hypothetical protein J4433_00760 [Candidatus Pacearchaeota archaeon]|nr:hypothetical protein [Candidatus Pacearchaeota archaeon]